MPPIAYRLGFLVLTPLLLFANRGSAALFTVLALAAIPRARLNRTWPWTPWTTAALAGLLVWGAASAAWEVSTGLALSKTAVQLAMALGAAVLCMGVAGLDGDGERRIVDAAAMGLVGAGLVGTADALAGMPITNFMHGLLTPGGNRYVPQVFKPAASVAAVLAIPVLGTMAAGRRWGAAAAVALAVAALAYTARSQSALLGLAGAAMAGAAWMIGRRLGAVVLVALILGGFAAAPFANRLPDSDRLAAAGIPNSTIHRALIWGFSAERIAERPWLGWGLDSSRAIPGGDDDTPITLSRHGGGTQLVPQQNLPLHPHNFVVQVWLELGAVGAGLFAALLLGLAARAAAQPARAAQVTAAGTLASGILVAATSFGAWQSWWNGCLILAAVLAATACRHINRQ